MALSKPMTSCGLHEPRAVLFYLGEECPLCEALEQLLAVKVDPETEGGRLVRQIFGIPREAMQGGCWDGEG